MPPKISLKLLVETRSKRVMFAEAGKDFIDFVFSLLTLPIGDVAKLISAGTMQGSFGRLFQSVDNMGASYLPKFKLYKCAGQCVTVTIERDAACPQCKQAMVTEMAFVLPSTATRTAAAGGAKGGSCAPGESEESCGNVKGLVTYMVTDGLEVTPMSAIASITVINKFSVGNDVELAEKYVSVDMDEGFALLRAALSSNTVLSDVFLARKK